MKNLLLWARSQLLHDRQIYGEIIPYGQLRWRLRHQLSDRLNRQLHDRLYWQFRDQLCRQIERQLYWQIYNQVCRQQRAKLREQLQKELNDE